MIDNKYFYNQLKKEIYTLSELQKKLRLQSESAPKGTLNIKNSASRGYSQYYNYLDGKRSYLPVEKKEIAQALAQKDYNEKVLAVVETRLKCAQKLLVQLEQRVEDLYIKLPVERKKLITPIQLIHIRTIL